jgi:hypothetical protein
VAFFLRNLKKLFRKIDGGGKFAGCKKRKLVQNRAANPATCEFTTTTPAL